MRLISLSIMFMIFVIPNLHAQSPIQVADSLYELRGDNFDAKSELADSTMINKVIGVCKHALTSTVDAEKEELTWKLMRAYYFKGRYSTHNSELKKKIYDLGKEMGELGLKEYPESTGINLFSAIVWGVWGEEYGILKAAKEGVAGKIKDRCEKVIAIDPDFDDAGGYRVLGRVFFKAPKIWPILRWPSKSEAVKILEKGHQLAPDNLVTQQFLAEALHAENQQERAVKLMKNILSETEIHEGIVEDAVVKSEVKATLSEWGN